MWMQGYFYWSGIIINAIFAFGILFGIYMSLSSMYKDWVARQKYWKEHDKKWRNK